MFKLFYNTIAACQRPVGPLLSNKCMYVCMYHGRKRSIQRVRRPASPKRPTIIFLCFETSFLGDIFACLCSIWGRLQIINAAINGHYNCFSLIGVFLRMQLNKLFTNKVAANGTCAKQLKQPTDWLIIRKRAKNSSATHLFFCEFSSQLSDLLVSVREQQVSTLNQREEFTQRLLTGTCFDLCAGHPRRVITTMTAIMFILIDVVFVRYLYCISCVFNKNDNTTTCRLFAAIL